MRRELWATRGPSTRVRTTGGSRDDDSKAKKRKRFRTIRKRSLEKGGKEESLVKRGPARGAGLPPVAAAGVIAGIDTPAHCCQIQHHQHQHCGKNQNNTTIHR